MASLILITGPPGAGKSTVAERVASRFERSVLIEETGLDHLHYVLLLPSVERCVARVLTRPGHRFADESATRKMHDEFARAEIARRHVIGDSPDDADAVAAGILSRVDRGELVYTP